MRFQLKKVLTGALAAAVGLFITGGAALAQNRTITGTVTDDYGEPLIGASVVVEGDASIGAITDLDGNYSISVPASAEALRFSYIGQKDAVETFGHQCHPGLGQHRPQRDRCHRHGHPQGGEIPLLQRSASQD